MSHAVVRKSCHEFVTSVSLSWSWNEWKWPGPCHKTQTWLWQLIFFQTHMHLTFAVWVRASTVRLLCSLHQSCKRAARLLWQFTRTALLHQLTIREHQQHVRVHDRIDSVSNHKQSAPATQTKWILLGLWSCNDCSCTVAQDYWCQHAAQSLELCTFIFWPATLQHNHCVPDQLALLTASMTAAEARGQAHND